MTMTDYAKRRTCVISAYAKRVFAIFALLTAQLVCAQSYSVTAILLNNVANDATLEQARAAATKPLATALTVGQLHIRIKALCGIAWS